MADMSLDYPAAVVRVAETLCHHFDSYGKALHEYTLNSLGHYTLLLTNTWQKDLSWQNMWAGIWQVVTLEQLCICLSGAETVGTKEVKRFFS